MLRTTTFPAALRRGRGHRPLHLLLLGATTILALALLAGPAAAFDSHGHHDRRQSPLTIYSSIPSPLPANLASEGPEAYAFDELGDQVEFAGDARDLTSVEVTLSDWACQSGRWYEAGRCVTTPGSGFELPITLDIYEVGAGNAVGPLIATDTQTFFVPFRPSDSPLSQCPEEGEQTWYDSASGTCNHGIASTISFELSSQEVTLPNRVIYGISYDSTHYGHEPVGQSAPCYSSSSGCPYDSLNIALSEEARIGTHPLPGTLYQQSPYGSEYCDGGAAGVGIFRLDSPGNPCWEGEYEGKHYAYLPAVAFHAANPPHSKQDCKHDGWRLDTDDQGNPFVNQGDCVSWLAKHEHAGSGHDS